MKILRSSRAEWKAMGVPITGIANDPDLTSLIQAFDIKKVIAKIGKR
ncbi:MAG: hypothetical protein OSB65_01040 [Roseibacillus sp.]|nr:hypothetical protein [Roseibacillus sp.]